jgi:carbamoyl-phosphate synthase large subunit
MNVQFAIQNGVIYVLEVNPRASRTVPFVSKATGLPLAKIAARVMTGRKLKQLVGAVERVPAISRSRKRCSRSSSSPRPTRSWVRR